MAAAVKFDDGSNHVASSGFPARQKFKSQQNETGSGAWLLAHHAEQRRHFKVVLCSKPRTFDEIRSQRKKAEKEGTTISLPPTVLDKNIDEENVLDGFFLLKHCCVQDPADLCTVNIAGQNLTETVAKDFELFENVAVVHAADNLLSLEPLSGFCALRELHIAVNGIRGITVEDGQFLYLQKLDMSFNNLSIGDVRELGNLPQLIDLDISGNNLYSLPVDMLQPAVYEQDATNDSDNATSEKSQTKMRFARLQRLIADDNKLSVDSVFVAMAGLPSLLHLSLQKNDIQRIPHLLAVGEQYMVQDEVSGRRTSSGRRSARRSARLSARKQRSKDEQAAANAQNPNNVSDTKLAITSQSMKSMESVPTAVNQPASVAENSESLQADAQASPLAINFAISAPFAFEFPALSVSEASSKQSIEDEVHIQIQSTLEPPFANLKHLNLASNKISKEEAVLAVTSWPCLRELVLYDNPLTLTNRTSNLLIVNKFLQEKLGIQVQCRKSVSPTRHHVEMTVKSERKVNSKVPAIPRCNVEQLLLSIEAAPTRSAPRSQSACELTSVSGRSPLPPIATSCNWSVDEGRDSNDVTEEDANNSATNDNIKRSIDAKERPPGTDQEGAPIFMTEVCTKERPAGTDQGGAPIFMTETGEVADEADDVSSELDDTEPTVDSPVASNKRPTKQLDASYDGYELLYDTDESMLDDNLPLPRDVVGNVRALNYALNHPLVFRDSHVHLDQKQKPFRSLPRKPDPSYTAGPTRTEKVNVVLNNLKTRETYVEALLSEAIADKKHNKDFANAKKLLTEVQQRYTTARISSVAAARQPSSMLSRHQANRVKVTSQTTK